MAPQRPTPWKLSVSPRFEIFFALWSLTSEAARRHPSWRRRTRRLLPSAFWSAQERLGGCAELWILLGDAPGALPLGREIESVVAALERSQPASFQRAMLDSVLHHQAAVNALLDGAALREAIALVPRAKRDWLRFMGLYPPLPDSPAQRAVGRLLRDPVDVRDAAAAALRLFWRESFAETWRTLVPQFEPALDGARRILASRDWPALERFGLNVEIDARARRLSALRGGYSIRFEEARAIHLMPSAFNERKFWTVLNGGGADTVYLPFLDLSASPDALHAAGGEPETDAGLVFRALGDATRLAMVKLIARGPVTAAELARWLSLSRPTVSHHLFELRQAELIEERPEGRSMLLEVNWRTLERLSDLAIDQLRRPAAGGEALPLTRKGSS
jgi:ArsR family transcriptional regulator